MALLVPIALLRPLCRVVLLLGPAWLSLAPSLGQPLPMVRPHLPGQGLLLLVPMAWQLLVVALHPTTHGEWRLLLPMRRLHPPCWGLLGVMWQPLPPWKGLLLPRASPCLPRRVLLLLGVAAWPRAGEVPLLLLLLLGLGLGLVLQSPQTYSMQSCARAVQSAILAQVQPGVLGCHFGIAQVDAQLLLVLWQLSPDSLVVLPLHQQHLS